MLRFNMVMGTGSLSLRTLNRHGSNRILRNRYSGSQTVGVKLTSAFSTFEKFPHSDGSLYSKELEKDSCGVGLVANMKKIASRQVVVDANEMLVSALLLFHQSLHL